MGIYDRPYGRSEQTPWDRVQQPRSTTITLIVITVAIFFVDMILVDRDQGSILADWLDVDAGTILRPWLWWQLLTYGFLHNVDDIWHVAFNMFGLFIFGRIVEQRVGQLEFLRFYLVAIVVGGIVGSLTSLAAVAMGGPEHSIIGASGAVIATAILFACYYPHQELLLFFVLPMKAWVAAVAFVSLDIAGAIGVLGALGWGGNTAFTVHLAGVGFALAYYFGRLSLRWLDIGRVADARDNLRTRSRRMKLKLHDPDRKIQQEAEEADRILEKIHRQGESSLTAGERRTLERYSRRQREKREG